MLHITICLALLTILAALYMLAKSRKEDFGSFIKWALYGVIIIASLVIICQFAQAIGRMCCHDKKCSSMEQCGPGMGKHMGMGGGMMMGGCMHGGCCEMGGGMCKHGMGRGMCMHDEMCGGGMCGHGEMGCCGKCSSNKSCGSGEEGEKEEGSMSGCMMRHGDSTSTKEVHKEIKIEKK